MERALVVSGATLGSWLGLQRQEASSFSPIRCLKRVSLISNALKKKGLLRLSKGKKERKKQPHLGVIFMAPFGSLRNHKSRNNDFSLYPPEKNISKD